MLATPLVASSISGNRLAQGFEPRGPVETPIAACKPVRAAGPTRKAGRKTSVGCTPALRLASRAVEILHAGRQLITNTPTAVRPNPVAVTNQSTESWWSPKIAAARPRGMIALNGIARTEAVAAPTTASVAPWAAACTAICRWVAPRAESVTVGGPVARMLRPTIGDSTRIPPTTPMAASSHSVRASTASAASTALALWLKSMRTSNGSRPNDTIAASAVGSSQMVNSVSGSARRTCSDSNTTGST